METETVWVDASRCSGCGACVEVCAVGAIALADGKAFVDEQRCTGCHTCIDACPERAIQPVVQGELVPATVTRPPATVRHPPAVATAAGVAVTGLGILVKIGRALVRAVGWWLAESAPDFGSAAGIQTSASRPRASAAGPSAARTGRQRRRRRRRRGR